MKDLQDVLAAWTAARTAGRRGVLATVVKVAGSAYRRPGARMFFTESGGSVGLLSGGCLEADLAQRAEEVLSSGQPSTVLYDMRSPDDIVWGLGLGCDGEIHVLLEPVDRAGNAPCLRFLERNLRERRPAVIVTVFAAGAAAAAGLGQRVMLWADGETDSADFPVQAVQPFVQEASSAGRSSVRCLGQGTDAFEMLVEYRPAPLRLWLFGAGTDAVPLVKQATALGWQVEIFDNREAYLDPARFPGAVAVRRIDFEPRSLEALQADPRTAAVVMTHHFLNDVELVRFLLAGASGYVGLMGPRKRAQTLLEELKKRGYSPEPAVLKRLHGPVGLDVGAETPEEIALSVAAEIQAVFLERTGGLLKHRGAPLHESLS